MRRRRQEPAEIGEGLDEGEDPQFVTALARGLEVLRAFDTEGGALSNLEIARRTGLPKPTVSRLAYTLGRLGHLTYDEDGRYRLGSGVLRLGFTYLRRTGLVAVARPMMQELADRTGMPVAIGSRDGFSMVYADVAQSDNPLTLALAPGSHIKLATSGMGRAYVAGLPEDRRQSLYAKLEKREGGNWPAIKAGLDLAVKDYREHGFSMSLGAWRENVHAVGVPLPLPDGSDVFAINCAAAALYLTEERMRDEVGPALVAVASRITAQLAHWAPR